MDIKKNKNTRETASREQKGVKNNPPKTQSVPKIKNKTAEKPQGTLLTKEPALILKSGDTDLRRGTKALNKLIEQTGNNPHDGNMYGFSNERNTVKIIQQKNDGEEMLVKKMIEPIINWPKYKEKGNPGYMVTCTGNEKDLFLDGFGLPKTL